MTEDELRAVLRNAVDLFVDDCIAGHSDGRLEDGPMKLKLYVSWEGTRGEDETPLYSAMSTQRVTKQL